MPCTRFLTQFSVGMQGPGILIVGHGKRYRGIIEGKEKLLSNFLRAYLISSRWSGNNEMNFNRCYRLRDNFHLRSLSKPFVVILSALNHRGASWEEEGTVSSMGFVFAFLGVTIDSKKARLQSWSCRQYRGRR